jgi:hypothetical protein
VYYANTIRGCLSPQKRASVALLTIVAAILFWTSAVFSAADMNGRRSLVMLMILAGAVGAD